MATTKSDTAWWATRAEVGLEVPTVAQTPTTDDAMAGNHCDDLSRCVYDSVYDLATKEHGLSARCAAQEQTILSLRQQMKAIFKEHDAIIRAYEQKTALLEDALLEERHKKTGCYVARSDAGVQTAPSARNVAEASVQADATSMPLAKLDAAALPFPHAARGLIPNRHRRPSVESNGLSRASSVSSLSSRHSDVECVGGVENALNSWWLDAPGKKRNERLSGETHSSSSSSNRPSMPPSPTSPAGRAEHYKRIGSPAFRSGSARFGNSKDLAMHGVTGGSNVAMAEENPNLPGVGSYDRLYRDQRGSYWSSAHRADSLFDLPATSSPKL